MYDFKTLCIFLHFLKDNRKRLIQNQIVWHLSSMPIILKNIDSEWKGKKVGTFGDAGCFSFYPTKNMTTSEGGAVVTRDPETARKCRLLINHVMEVRYHHDDELMDSLPNRGVMGRNDRKSVVNTRFGGGPRQSL